MAIDLLRSGITAPLFNDPMAPMAKAEFRVQGRVARVIFENAEDSFYIFSVQRTGTTGFQDQVKVKGYGYKLAVGQDVDCSGVYEANKNPRYKDELTLSATAITEVVPTTVEGIRRLLHNGFVKGIGPKYADALLAHFGHRLFDVAEHSPERLYNVPGLGDARVKAFVNAVREKKAVPRIMSYLAEIGLGPGLSHRVFKTLGSQAVSIIKNDPYTLTQVPMIGFAKADKVARDIGIANDSPSRIRAAMEAVLQKAAEEGSTAVSLPKLLDDMKRALTYKDGPGFGRANSVPLDRIASVVAEAVGEAERVVPRELSDGTKVLSLPEYVRQERSIAKNIARLVHSPSRALASVDLSSPKFAHLDEDQLAAARMALTSNVSVITGRPGCGKTTVTRSIIQVLEGAGLKYLACGPTGRAAKRFQEATGYEASTMHRALESRGTGQFGRDESNPLWADFIIADEQSMSDTYISYALLKAVESGTQLLYVGDVDQLSSIGAGAVLKDIIRSGKVPVATLTKPHRQAADSDIITNAHRIIEGQVPVRAGKKNDFHLVTCTEAERQVDTILEQYEMLIAKGFKPEDIQILTPMRHKTDLGANNLNKVLKGILNPGTPENSIKRRRFDSEMVFSTGDRVMQVANNKDLGIYNGDIGYIISIDKINDEIAVDFSGEVVSLTSEDLDDVDLAFASTIHKAQGSEFPAVIIPLSKGHWHMWDRNLLYTGTTRGKQEVAVVGDTYMLKSVVEKESASTRLTGLQEEIRAAFDAFEAKHKVDRRLRPSF